MPKLIIHHFHLTILRQDVIYLDANNLYGHAMSQYLPTGGFRIMSSEEVALDLVNLSDE